MEAEPTPLDDQGRATSAWAAAIIGLFVELFRAASSLPVHRPMEEAMDTAQNGSVTLLDSQGLRERGHQFGGGLFGEPLGGESTGEAATTMVKRGVQSHDAPAPLTARIERCDDRDGRSCRRLGS